MFPSRATTLSLYLPKILYDCSRNVRGGVTIPLKKVKPLIPRKVKETYSHEELKKTRRADQGIAHSVMRRIECGYDNNVDTDPEDFLDTDLDAFDSKYIIKEHRKLAETDLRTKNFYNIKRRHFKEEKLPNMLTYVEKQQIRHLHKEDPEVWDTDKLAKSFPASPAIIRKVLKSRFTACTIDAVKKHDKTVRKNWDLFQKGKLPLDDELSSHYKKFVGRLKLETNENEIKKFLPSPPDFSNQPIKEFSEIISSSKKYQRLKEKERNKLEMDESGKVIHTSKYMEVKAIGEDERTQKDSPHLTLDQLRKKLDSSKNKTENEVLISEGAPKKSLPSAPESRKPRSKKSPPIPLEDNNPQDIYYKEFDYLNKDTGVVDKKLPYDFFDAQEDHVAFSIHIPKHLWQEGKLYRIKDCFYDDQGVFLYRVPGLF